jgi:dTDP-4-dehydrorhamnose 3,5-epimerase-like enzyme
MKLTNIFNRNDKDLEIFKDNRGIIADVFYNSDIAHVTLISSVPNALRGNHYHKETEQTMLITKGSLEYWYKPVDSNVPAKMCLCKVGDLITTDPNEIHALRITEEGNEFIVFTKGKRGGKDYESDTYRTESIIKNLIDE